MDNQSYDPLTRHPPNKPLKMIPGSAAFPLLELILNPVRTCSRLLRDAVLVSIDLEYILPEGPSETLITQIGIATLDTRKLSSVDTTDPQALRTAIDAHCFSLYVKRRGKRTWEPHFLWGQPEIITHDRIRSVLKEALHDRRDAPHITTRNVVLVGHGIWNERHVLMEAIGYDIKEVPSVRAILDTGRMICSAYDFGMANHAHFPLRFGLRCLGVHYDNLHDAGNDAMFTMKALLLIFANWKHQKGRYMWNMLDIDDSGFGLLNTTHIEPNESADLELLWELQIEVLVAIAREPWMVPRKTTVYKEKEKRIRQHMNNPLCDQALGLAEFFEIDE